MALEGRREDLSGIGSNVVDSNLQQLRPGALVDGPGGCIRQVGAHNAVRVICDGCGTENWQYLWEVSNCWMCHTKYAHYQQPYESK